MKQRSCLIICRPRGGVPRSCLPSCAPAPLGPGAEWSAACAGELRRYTCGLWTLFHALDSTAQVAVLRLPIRTVLPKKFSPKTIAAMIAESTMKDDPSEEDAPSDGGLDVEQGDWGRAARQLLGDRKSEPFSSRVAGKGCRTTDIVRERVLQVAWGLVEPQLQALAWQLWQIPHDLVMQKKG